MLERYKFSEVEQKELMKSIVIIVDSREKSNKHITDYFDKHNIPYVKRAMDFGDYSFYVPENKELSIMRDMSFEKEIIIERKNSAEELAKCLTKTRADFEEELTRAVKSKKYLLVENCNYRDIVSGNYKSEYGSKSYLGSLHSFDHRYDLRIMFMPDKSYSPIFIYGVMQYYLRGLLK